MKGLLYILIVVAVVAGVYFWTESVKAKNDLSQKDKAYARSLDSLTRVGNTYKLEVLRLSTRINLLKDSFFVQLAQTRAVQRRYLDLKNQPVKKYSDQGLDSVLATLYPSLSLR